MSILDTLSMYFQYPFIRYAFIVGILISLCSSLLGVVLVLKRFSYIGDGLSHVAFGAMAIAAVLHLTSGRLLLVLPITVIAAILLLRKGRNSKVSGDAKIAMISVSSLAFGYLLMNVFGTSSNTSADVCSTLFGATSILTLTSSEVWICVILSTLGILLYILYYNRIFALTFDEDFAKATGENTERYDLIVAIVIAVIIVLAMNLVGSLLISALVIFPAITSMQLFKSFKQVSIASALFAIATATIGMLIALVQGTPVGSTIVVMDVVVFVLMYCLSFVLRIHV
ncbi:MAG: metal ABC transporter permease [Solobacterium sp.]|nr:metal ABC transporter permease [Solobacterium sp.]